MIFFVSLSMFSIFLFLHLVHVCLYAFLCALACLIKGSANRPSRRNSKRPADRQPRPARSDVEAEEDEVSVMLKTQPPFLLVGRFTF